MSTRCEVDIPVSSPKTWIIAKLIEDRYWTVLIPTTPAQHHIIYGQIGWRTLSVDKIGNSRLRSGRMCSYIMRDCQSYFDHHSNCLPLVSPTQRFGPYSSNHTHSPATNLSPNALIDCWNSSFVFARQFAPFAPGTAFTSSKAMYSTSCFV